MDIRNEVLSVLDEVLMLDGRAQGFTVDTPLLGALPELDSMAVIGLIHALEERFGFISEDDDLDGSTFATVGTLLSYVESVLERQQS